MGPQNAIIGDDYGTDIPVTQVDPKALLEEQKAARYSKSKEYKKLKADMDARIAIYQKYLPDGRPVKAVTESDEELGRMWRLANSIIAEFNDIMTEYTDARTSIETVE